MRTSDRFGSMWRLRDRKQRGRYDNHAVMRLERRLSGGFWGANRWLGRRGARWRWAVRLILREMPF